MTFVPTYLYIKQHTITGKMYFGKTYRDPIKYLGSGKYWLRHIKSHGKEHIVTLWYDQFNSQCEMTDFALNFSKSMDIVRSETWLNLTEENGLDGGVPGYKHSVESRKRMSLGQRGCIKGVKTKEHRKKIGDAQRGVSRPASATWAKELNARTVGCPHCGKQGQYSNMKRWHFDNCRLNGDRVSE